MQIFKNIIAEYGSIKAKIEDRIVKSVNVVDQHIEQINKKIEKLNYKV